MKKLLGMLSGAALVVIACGSSSRRADDGGTPGGAGEAGAGTGGGGLGGGAGKSGAGGTGGNKGGRGGGAGQGGELPIAGESGTGGTGVPCSTDPGEIAGLSFDVDLQYTAGDATALHVATVFHFEQVGGGLEVVVGSEGQAFRGEVTPSGSRLKVEPGLRIRDEGSPYGVATNNGITVKSLSLCFHPARDSSVNLDGKGVVRVVRNGDDYVNEYDATVDFSGAPWDSTAPELPPSQTLDPLDPDDLKVSEPLQIGAIAALDDPAQTQLTAIEQAGTVVAFHPATVLPLGFEANVGTDARDLSGNKLVPDCTVRTDDDPGVQALDGFESELRVLNLGRYGAALVSGGQALEGAQSLEVPGGGIALLHLTRPTSGAQHLRFDLQPVPRLVEVPASFFVRAGVVGGSEVATQEIPLPYPLPLGGEGGAAGAGGAGSGSFDVIPIDLELPDAGEDILLEITAPFIEQSASTDASAIVDRLRLE